MLQPFLAIRPRGTCLVGNAGRIDPTTAPPAAPQDSWVPCLFNCTDQHVPKSAMKFLSKQSWASYRSLLPTPAESGTTTPCPVTTQRESKSVCKIPARSFMMKSNFLLALNFSLNFSCLHPHLTSKLLETHHLPGVRNLGCRDCATLFFGKLFCLPLWRQNQHGTAVTALPSLCSKVPSWSTLPLAVDTHIFSIPLFGTTRGAIPSLSFLKDQWRSFRSKENPNSSPRPSSALLYLSSLSLGGTILHK